MADTDLVFPDLVYPDNDLTDDQRAFARRIRAFAKDKLEPGARAIDEEIRFDPQSVKDLAAAGILGGPIATEFGGGGWDPMHIAIANEEVGAVCGNARGFMAVHSGLVSQCIEKFGNDAQKREWLPKLIRAEIIGCCGITEEEAGSDVASLRCRAATDAGGAGYRITGKKIWITNGGIADVGLIFATVDPDMGHDGITGFLVDMNQDGITRTRMPGVELGHRGSDHAQLTFDGARVTADRIVGGIDGGPGNGFKVAMGSLSCGRLSVAAGAVGIHRAALAASIAFVNERQQFGRPIARFQMVQERIADMTVALLASRELVHRLARRRATTTETPGDLAAAKLFATESAATAADTAIMLHGGRGYSTAHPVERLLRDAIGLRIYEGTTMIQKAILARAVL